MTPDEFTNQEFFLDVGDGHQLYVQDWGNAHAKMPIVYLHGGPGNGCDDRDKRGFDPKSQRIIFHDQRGAGKSLPSGSLESNTTQHLVSDIERIVERLKLKKFVLVGGSWGSTLALCYGIAHPERVAGMVINGVFTATKAELVWFWDGGWRQFFPDVWQQYLEDTPPEHRQHPAAYHLKTAFGPDTAAAKRSAYAYEKMELALLKLDDHYKPGDYATYEPKVIRTEMHFDNHSFFLPESYILKHAHKLTMQITLLVGRYDMICPPQAAYELDRALPNSQLVWTINGHLRQHEAKNIQQILLKQLLGEQ